MLRIHQLTKSFGPETVLRGVSCSLAAGKTLSMLGKSGSGKSTLLRIIAGLETADAGEIYWRDEAMLQQSPQARNMVYLYQAPLLFPHLNVFENLAFGLRVRKRPQAAVQQTVDKLLQQLDLVPHAQKRPEQLSGGQQQRVNFGRALIIKPSVLLLDEPFGKLDAHTRAQMQQLFQRIAQEEQMTALFVTHDLKEAMLMGDQIGYMQSGELKVYPDQAAFLADPETGAAQERAFWQKLG